MDFRKKVHDRCARCDRNEVFGSVRKVTIGDKSVNSVLNGGLMSGCQIPVNPTIRSSVTQLSVGFIPVLVSPPNY